MIDFNTVTVVSPPAFSISADILSIPGALLFFSLLTARRIPHRTVHLFLALLLVQRFQLYVTFSPAHESFTVFWRKTACRIRTSAHWFFLDHFSIVGLDTNPRHPVGFMLLLPLICFISSYTSRVFPARWAYSASAARSWSHLRFALRQVLLTFLQSSRYRFPCKHSFFVCVVFPLLLSSIQHQSMVCLAVVSHHSIRVQWQWVLLRVHPS